MGGSQPSHTSQVMKPDWKPGTGQDDYRYLDQILNRGQNLYYDPVTGQPRPYTGPDQQMGGFDPYEQMGYDRGGGMASAGTAGGYAQNFASNLYGQMNPQAQSVLQDAMRGQYTAPKDGLQGADRMAAQNVEDILSGRRLDPAQNPAMQAVMDSVGRQVRKQRATDTASTSGAFGSGGTMGGSKHRQAQMQVEENADRAIADAQAQMGMDFYNQGIQTQDALAQNISQAGAQARQGTAGNMYGMGAQYDLNRQYTDADRMMQLGGYRRQITDRNRDVDFQNQMRAWEWMQQAPGRQAELYGMLQRGAPNQVTQTQSPGIPGAALGMAGAGLGMQGARIVGEGMGWLG